MLLVWPKKKKNFIGADTEIKRNNSDDKELLDQTLHYNYRNEAHLDVNDKFKLMDYYKKTFDKCNKVFGSSMEFTTWYLQFSRNPNRHAN